jgi:hypothetical protein
MNKFELRKTLLLAVAIVYGCKLIRSTARNSSQLLLRSSVKDVVQIMKLIASETRQ